MKNKIMKMSKSVLLAQLVSFVFHPLFMPLYAVLLYFRISPRYFLPQNVQFLVYYLVLVSIIIPLLFIFLLKHSGVLTGFTLKFVRERLFFSTIMTMVYLIIFTKIIRFDYYIELYPFFLGIFLSLLTLTLYNYFKKKPSIHAMATAGILTFFIIWSYYSQVNILSYVSLMIIISAVVIAMRLYIDAHDFKQILTGLFVGIGAQILSFYLVWLFF